MLHKTTNKLFKGAYQYKIVLVCAAAQYFRSGDMDATLERLQSEQVVSSSKPAIKQYQMQYAFALQAQLKKLSNIDIRVESPWISIYSNSKSDIDALIAIDQDCVKYVSSPPQDMPLSDGVIIMSKRDYDYRITLGKTRQNYSSFVEWAESNSPKLKLTISCKRDLLKDRSWGGSYFYLTGDNVLLMAKMHLGGSISKIERITKKIG